MNNGQSNEKPLLWIGDTPFTGTDLLEAMCMQKLQIPIAKELVLKKELDAVEITESDNNRLLGNFKTTNKLTKADEYNRYLEKNKINEKVLKRFLQRPEKIRQFKEEKWGPRVNALYLRNKDKYDKMSYYLLKSTNSDVMQEVYFRLKDKEETWESMSSQFPGSISPMKGPIAIEKIESNLVKRMRSAGTGKIIKPLRIENEYIIAELINVEPSKLDQKLREKILEDEFNEWLKTETNTMLKKTRIGS